MQKGQVDDIEVGVYVWRDENGKYVADSDHNYMMIASRKGDKTKIEALKRAAAYYGVTTGEAEFRSGARPVSDEEFERQKERQAQGLVPDEYDLGNLLDEYKYQKEFKDK